MDADPATPPAPAPSRRHRRALRWTVAGLALAVSLVALLLGSAWWALSSATGSAWLLGRVPGLTIDAPRGSLIGDFAAARAQLEIPGSGHLQLTDLRWHGLRIGRAPAGLWLRIRIDRLEAGRVEWQGQPSPRQRPPRRRPTSRCRSSSTWRPSTSAKSAPAAPTRRRSSMSTAASTSAPSAAACTASTGSRCAGTGSSSAAARRSRPPRRCSSRRA